MKSFPFFFFSPSVPLKRKPTAPNDLRAPGKTKDSLHPPARVGQRAPGGEFDHCPLHFSNLIRTNSSCWQRREGKGRQGRHIRLENHRLSMSVKWEKCVCVCRMRWAGLD